MKKILTLSILLFSASFLCAKPVNDAPMPPEVTESDLNFTAKEFEKIKNSQPDVTDDKNEKGALTKSIGDNKDGVRVIQLGDDTIEEYHRSGEVYQIRVVPRIGKPYYVQPKNENAVTDEKNSNPTSNWKVLSF